MKKAQITIFIILSLIIIVIIIFLLSIINKEKNRTINKDQQVIEPIITFTQNCLKDTSYQGVYQIGKTGGYFETDFHGTSNKVAYYYDSNKDLSPSREDLEEEVNRYVRFILPFCIRGFENFPDFNITEDEINVTTRIEDQKVFLNVSYPLTINKGDKTSFVENFNEEIPIRLGFIHNEAKTITKEQIDNAGSFCISCITERSERDNLTVKMLEFEDSIIVTIEDGTSKLYGKNFTYSFASKY